MSSRVLSLRRPDVCCACGRRLDVGTRAFWDAQQRSVTCLGCLTGALTAAPVATVSPALDLAQPASVDLAGMSPASPPPAPEGVARRTEIDRGRPGASAEREHLRRRRSREARTRRSHPRIGGLLLALKAPPPHESAFARGGRGERAVARSLERRTSRGPAVILHDRRMPGGYGNIDHLAIAPRGVFVIDAKAIRGEVRIARAPFGKPRLLVRGRSRPKLIAGLDRQVLAVRRALAEGGHAEVPVEGLLCFTEARLPLLGRKIAGHQLHHCRGVARILNRRGPLSAETIQELTRALCAKLPSA